MIAGRADADDDDEEDGEQLVVVSLDAAAASSAAADPLSSRHDETDQLHSIIDDVERPVTEQLLSARAAGPHLLGDLEPRRQRRQWRVRNFSGDAELNHQPACAAQCYICTRSIFWRVLLLTASLLLLPLGALVFLLYVVVSLPLMAAYWAATGRELKATASHHVKSGFAYLVVGPATFLVLSISRNL